MSDEARRSADASVKSPGSLAGGATETPVRNTPPARKLAWNRPTVRVMHIERTSSAPFMRNELLMRPMEWESTRPARSP